MKHKGHEETAKVLIEAGAALNLQDEDGCTALMEASIWGHIDTIRLLIERGADVNVRGQAGVSAIQRAIREGHFYAVKLLIEHGAILNSMDKFASVGIAEMKGHTKNTEFSRLVHSLP